MPRPRLHFVLHGSPPFRLSRCSTKSGLRCNGNGRSRKDGGVEGRGATRRAPVTGALTRACPRALRCAAGVRSRPALRPVGTRPGATQHRGGRRTHPDGGMLRLARDTLGSADPQLTAQQAGQTSVDHHLRSPRNRRPRTRPHTVSESVMLLPTAYWRNQQACRP